MIFINKRDVTNYVTGDLPARIMAEHRSLTIINLSKKKLNLFTRQSVIERNI